MQQAEQLTTLLERASRREELTVDELNALQAYCMQLSASTGELLSEAYELAQIIYAADPSRVAIAAILQSLSLKLLDHEMCSEISSRQQDIDLLYSQLNIAAFLDRMPRVKTLADRLSLVQEHRVYGTKMEAISKLHPIKYRPKTYTNNKIRVGILSSGLCAHPVGYFSWPIIKYLDKSKFELYCYSSAPGAPDHMQGKISQEVDSFKTYSTESAQAIAQEIADDQLDLMMDLSGHMSFGKSTVCTYRPAPIQISWLDYLHSLGFPTAIDYIMLDVYIKPPISELLIEKPLVMPKTWAAIDQSIFPTREINSSTPEDRNGYITIGTLSAPHKLTPETFEVWADIMHRIPNSKFLYARNEAASLTLRRNFTKHMLNHNISPEKIRFVTGFTGYNHLDCYNEIDIALDTFPHAGGATTCESLWMGTPVVTLVGLSFFERVGYSTLSNANLGDLCAFTTEEYKNKVVCLAQDKERRRYLRRNLRQQILQNPLGQPQQFATDFSQAIIDILKG